MLWFGQAGGIAEACTGEPEALSFAIHHFDESGFCARDGFGQGDAGIVAGLRDHAVQQIIH